MAAGIRAPLLLIISLIGHRSSRSLTRAIFLCCLAPDIDTRSNIALANLNYLLII